MHRQSSRVFRRTVTDGEAVSPTLAHPENPACRAGPHNAPNVSRVMAPGGLSHVADFAMSEPSHLK
jgi:hypothetical protein